MGSGERFALATSIAYISAKRVGIWCRHLLVVYVRHSFARGFEGNRGRKIHSFTLSVVLIALAASASGGVGCCWDCSCCIGCSGCDVGSGSVSTGASVVSC